MAKTHVGLEITEESVRAVEVTAGRAQTIVAFGEVPLPPGAARDSEVLDLDAVSVALRQLWSRAGISSKKVVLGIGSRRILVREYTTTMMRPDLIKQALPFQVQDLLPVPVNQAVLDFYPTAQTDDQVSGLLVAAVSETVEQLIAAVSHAKLSVARVDLVPFGLARISSALASPTETVAMIHIGDHTTYVVVATGGVPQFVRIIPIDVATAAARARQARVEAQSDVEGMLETVPPAAPPQPMLRSQMWRGDAYDPAVVDLASRLNSTIAFYRDRVGAGTVSAVHVSGAGIAVPGVLQALAPELNAPVTVLNIADLLPSKHTFEQVDDHMLNFISTVGVVFREGS